MRWAETNQTTEAGPPSNIGVLKVVAMEEHIPMILKAARTWKESERESVSEKEEGGVGKGG